MKTGGKYFLRYLKSPLNYTGGKFKLLPQLLPLFPSEIGLFVDLFGGGFNVGVNAKADIVIYNDVLSPVTDMLEYFADTGADAAITEIKEIVNLYKLSKTNREGYLELRHNYNTGFCKGDKFECRHIQLYSLLAHSFNNQIRFNQNDDFNMPFGKERSSFNPTLEKRFYEFVSKIHNNRDKYKFTSFEFSEYTPLSLKFEYDNIFVYCDPPYFNSTATYNENGGWGADNERELLSLLDSYNDNGIKFALSNNLKYNNDLLLEWLDKYKVIYLNANYSNCSYQKKDKGKDIEILVVNY